MGVVVGYASTSGALASLSVAKVDVEASLGGTVTDGDILVATLSADWGDLPTSPETGWTSLAYVANGSGAGRSGVRVQAREAASEGSSWTFATTTNDTPDATLSVIVLRGWTLTAVAASASIHAAQSGSSSFATEDVDHGGVAGSIHLAGVWTENGSSQSWSPPAGMTEFADLDSSGKWTSTTAAYQVGPSDPTGSKTFTWSASDTMGFPWLSWGVVLQPSSTPITGALAGGLASLASAGGQLAGTVRTAGALAGGLPVLAVPGGALAGTVGSDGAFAGPLPVLPLLGGSLAGSSPIPAPGPWRGGPPTRPGRWTGGALTMGASGVG